MADTFSDDIPAVANQIADDLERMKKSLGFLKDCFEALCSGWSDSSAASLITKISYDAVATVAAKDTASIVNASVQINESDNTTAVTEAIGFMLYLSSDSAGQTLATAPSTLAVGTDGTILVEHTANVVMSCISEADGDFDINITDTATAASFVNVLLPTGKIVTSDALSWS